MIITGNNIEVLRTYPNDSFDAVVTDPPYGLSFMGKKWDYDVPSVELWKEVLRVLKPGGHMLCACGTRTQHRMAVNIEDAGFEIRDIVSWIYASGFPKAMNISKEIDRQAGAERKVIGKGNDKGRTQTFGAGETRETFITEPSTEAAKQWAGWHTAIKPAHELWTLARKPLSCNTIAENVLKYGTGGLNIDGCRIGDEGGTAKGTFPKGKSNGIYGDGINGACEINDIGKGRFPANLVFSCDCEGQHEDGCPVGELDRQSGVRKSGGANGNRTKGAAKGEFLCGLNPINTTDGRPPDIGGASRFFFVAKASKSERNKGLEGFEKKVNGVGALRDNGRESELRQNTHPTVKPVTLMRYLCRLITPPKGIILDPYNGSGTTGIAAALEWFEYVGIEQEQDYSKISQARQPPPDLFT